MATAGLIGHTTTLQWAGNPIAEITRIGGISISVTKVDSTSLGSANYYKEILPGLLDAGDVDIEGIFDPSDTTGQIALMVSMEARTSAAFIMTFPAALATTWTGTAYVTKFATDEVTSEGMIPFSATLSIVGQPSLNISLAAGMTGLTGTETSGAITIEPTIAVGTYIYSSRTDLTGDWITLTPVGAGMTFEITALGVTHTVLTGVATGHITVGGADTTTPVYIKCYATAGGTVARNYTLYVTYP